MNGVINNTTAKVQITDPALQAEWAKKRLVWVPHDTEGFVKASIIKEDADTYTVELCENGQQLKLSKDDCQKMNPPKFDKVIRKNGSLLSYFIN
jgi:myosin protein heavy chain